MSCIVYLFVIFDQNCNTMSILIYLQYFKLCYRIQQQFEHFYYHKTYYFNCIVTTSSSKVSPLLVYWGFESRCGCNNVPRGNATVSIKIGQ
jgi:hypothetical protein